MFSLFVIKTGMFAHLERSRKMKSTSYYCLSPSHPLRYTIVHHVNKRQLILHIPLIHRACTSLPEKRNSIRPSITPDSTYRLGLIGGPVVDFFSPGNPPFSDFKILGLRQDGRSMVVFFQSITHDTAVYSGVLQPFLTKDNNEIENAGIFRK
ncbi:hypothetical protein VTN96DRAFT_5536 [Rasamsonia emersonii]